MPEYSNTKEGLKKLLSDMRKSAKRGDQLKLAALAVALKRPLIEDRLSIEQALPLVEPQVQDAIERLKRFGIPFFEQLARR